MHNDLEFCWCVNLLWGSISFGIQGRQTRHRFIIVRSRSGDFPRGRHVHRRLCQTVIILLCFNYRPPPEPGDSEGGYRGHVEDVTLQRVVCALLQWTPVVLHREGHRVWSLCQKNSNMELKTRQRLSGYYRYRPLKNKSWLRGSRFPRSNVYVK